MRRILLFILLGAMLTGCISGAPAVFVPVDALPLTPAQPTVAPTPTATVATQPEAEAPATTVTSLTLPAKEPIVEPTPEPTPTPQAVVLPGTELFTFVAGELGWSPVDDNVMGGVSNSTVDFAEPSVMRFTGVMSLANNGGFSSVRSDWRPMDLTGADGVLLRVMGDGKSYRLRIRTADTGRNISYNALFETTPDTWQMVYVPFADMVPTYFGSVVDAGPLNPASIGSFGFMLSDKQPGEFTLRVDWVRTVTEAEVRAMAG